MIASSQTKCSLSLRPKLLSRECDGLLEVGAAVYLYHPMRPLCPATQVFSKCANRSKFSQVEFQVARHISQINDSPPRISSYMWIYEFQEVLLNRNELCRYDTRNLSPESAQTVVRGFGSTLFVDKLLPQGDGRDKYWAFELKKPIAVRVSTLLLGSKAPSCPITLIRDYPISYTTRLGTGLCKTGSSVLVKPIGGHEPHASIYT